jgi:hypothetical protein
LWDVVIRARRVTAMLPVLEGVLSGFGRHRPEASDEHTGSQALVPNQVGPTPAIE